MWNTEDIKKYFYKNTRDFEISDVILEESKDSYFDSIDCYRVKTAQKIDFFVFVGSTTLVNLYPIRNKETLDECYYKHIGFIAEYASSAIHQNFILDFIKDTSVFPILNRRMTEIGEDITLDKNASQLSGLANQIRNCYITLTDYLMNKIRSHNSEFKNDNFKDNLSEFLGLVLPGKESTTRRNVISSIAEKGWKLNTELVHKDSITVFDIMISFNILQLVVSSISNIIVGNNMPFNKIKCPNCKGEKYSLQQDSEHRDYHYRCDNCGLVFDVSLDEIIKEI